MRGSHKDGGESRCQTMMRMRSPVELANGVLVAFRDSPCATMANSLWGVSITFLELQGSNVDGKLRLRRSRFEHSVERAASFIRTTKAITSEGGSWWQKLPPRSSTSTPDGNIESPSPTATSNKLSPVAKDIQRRGVYKRKTLM
ncbi:hypothetical protein M378DRAFT_432037 [Amanita muscaria Koide BX008]|uniref:Uncharacterized protein n=1 Tax=Amanita muscaria (strain Koide BX008) TaxID=946122 RepID=A0A0C2XBB2_AMAMK|nr:hypothetical protein M378DRAFT_432037 [Amanita muscaria Koide BX008]